MLVAKRDPVFNKDLLGLARKKKRWWGWLMNEDNTYESDSSIEYITDSDSSSDDALPQIGDIVNPFSQRVKRREIKPIPSRKRHSKPINPSLSFVSSLNIEEEDEQKENELDETPSDLNTNPYLPSLEEDTTYDNSISSNRKSREEIPVEKKTPQFQFKRRQKKTRKSRR